MKTEKKITLSIWEILKYKIWDHVCEIKGFDDEFIFSPVYENTEEENEFSFTLDEIKTLGIPINTIEC